MTRFKQTVSMDDLNEFCTANNIFIYIDEPLPAKVKGFYYKDSDEYNVYLNPNHSFMQLKLTLIHELIHAFENQFYYDDPVTSEENVDYIIGELKEYFI